VILNLGGGPGVMYPRIDPPLLSYVEQQKQDWAVRPCGALAFDLQEIPEGILVVGLAQAAFKRNPV
jgi:hypothetical protein